MKKPNNEFETYLRRKYFKKNYTPTEILNFRNDLEKKYGKKIIPELNETGLNDEESLAKIEYSVLSELLRKEVPEIGKYDKIITSHIKVEQKVSGRLANVIFLLLKLASFIWVIIFLFILIGNFSVDSLFIFALAGLTPFLIVMLLEVFYWYIAGIIEFDEIFSTYRDNITGIFKN